MPQLYDTEAQNWVEVPPESTREQLRSGKMTMEPPRARQASSEPAATVKMVDTQGRLLEVPADRVDAMAQIGARPETESDRVARRRQEYFGDRALEAGAAGAARGLTFGASDVLLGGLGGPEVRAELSGVKEENPVASMVGEIGGAVIPALLSGGSSAAATGAATIGRGAAVARGAASAARGVGVLPASVARLGMGVEQAIAGTSATLGRRIAAKAAGSAVEGALYGAGSLTSELALAEDPVLTADKIISHVGMGALVGGAAGGLFGVGEEAVSGILGVTGRGLEKVRRSVSDGDGIIGSIPDKIKRRYAKAAASVSERSEDDIYRLLSDKKFRQAATSPLDIREDAARKMAKTLDGFESSSRPIEESAIGAMKKAKVRELVAPGNERGAGLSILDDMRSAVDEFKENPGIYGSWGVGKSKQLRKLITDTEKTIGGSADNADVFIALDTLKRKMGKFGKPGGFPNAEQAEAVTQFRSMYDRIRDHLEDASLYGKAAEAQQRINRQWTEYLGNNKLFQRQFLKKTGQEGWVPVYRADPGSLRNYIDNMTGARGDLASESLETTLRNRQSLIKEIAEFYDVDPALISSAQKSANEMGELLENMRETVGAQNILRDMGKSDDASSVVAAILGGTIGGWGGAAVTSAMVNAITNPAKMIRIASAMDDKIIPLMQRAARGFDGRMAKAVSILTSSGVKAGAVAGKVTYRGAKEAAKTEVTSAARARRAVAPASSKLLSFLSGGQNERESLRDQIKNLGSIDPIEIAERVQRVVGEAGDIEPAMLGAMIQRSVAATQFLQSKLPKNPHTGRGMRPLEWNPSNAELAQFERYVRAIEDPLTVVEDAAQNKLTPEGVESLRVVYPSLYNELVSKIQAAIETAPTPLPYSRRAALSLLLDQPFDASFEPRYIATMQASYGPQGPQQGGAPPSQGLGQSRIAENSQTEGQRLLG